MTITELIEKLQELKKNYGDSFITINDINLRSIDKGLEIKIWQ